MTTLAASAQRSPTISDERLRNVLRRELNRAINVERTFTRGELENESGVSVHQIDQIMSRDVSKKRRVAIEDAFSLADVLGDRCINALLATLGWVGRPQDGGAPSRPMQIAANCMQHLSVIARAAADDQIDHTEEPDTTSAADLLIAEVLPLSSAGRKA